MYISAAHQARRNLDIDDDDDDDDLESTATKNVSWFFVPSALLNPPRPPSMDDDSA